LARPHIFRKISCLPDVPYFKPAGIPVRHLQEIILTIDEYEALRLADLEKMYHENAARKMGISRQTFGNILAKAHFKIADSIVNGKAIKIEGGVYEMKGVRTFICIECKHQWQVLFGTGRPQTCPQCESKNIHRSPTDRGFNPEGGRKKEYQSRRSQ
jgi:predicted DNA-binding protein (UPF0251 family)